jgi:hypothetical protein
VAGGCAVHHCLFRSGLAADRGTLSRYRWLNLRETTPGRLPSQVWTTFTAAGGHNQVAKRGYVKTASQNGSLDTFLKAKKLWA